MADRTITTTIENGVLRVACNGESFEVNPSSYSDDIRTAAMLHGFKQKIIDAAALSRDDNGRPASPRDKMAAMRDVERQLAMGDWNRRASGDGTASVGLLVAALMRVSGQDRDAVAATVSGWTPEQQRAVRESAAIAPVVAEIKAERAARRGGEADPVDVSDLLAGFVGVPEVPTAPANDDGSKAPAKAARVKKAA